MKADPGKKSQDGAAAPTVQGGQMELTIDNRLKISDLGRGYLIILGRSTKSAIDPILTL